MSTLKVAIFYGGEAATEPRDALLNWLRRSQTATIIGHKIIEARKVADDVAHSQGAVDERVEQAIDWADKAIMLFTPDSRSEYGAPNLLEEYGRWRSKKGGQSMAVIRHEDVKVHSNAAGLVYIGYQNDVVTETSEKLLMFLQAAAVEAKVTASTTFDLGKIHTLLVEGFNDRQLRQFCRDTPEFKPVQNQLGRRMGKNAIVDEIIDYAEQQERLSDLLTWAAQQNPAKYKKHEPYTR